MGPPRTPAVSPREVHALVRALLARGHEARFRVTGASMWPFIRAGDVVTARPVAPGEPAVGGVVVLWHASRRQLLVHRVVARRRGGVLTRGDAAPSPDGIVAPADVLGIVRRVDRGAVAVRVGTGAAGAAVALLARLRLWRHIAALARRPWLRAQGDCILAETRAEEAISRSPGGPHDGHAETGSRDPRAGGPAAHRRGARGG